MNRICESCKEQSCIWDRIVCDECEAKNIDAWHRQRARDMQDDEPGYGISETGLLGD